MKIAYKKILMVLAPVVLLIIFFIGVWKAAPQFTGTEYHDTHYGFSVNYPGQAVRVLNSKNQMATSGYIPACDPETSLVCFVFPSDTFPKSNFESAGVAVGILNDATTEQSCFAQMNGEMSNAGDKTINGIVFRSFSYGDAATSHRSNGFNYRTFHNGACYQLSTRLNTTVFEVYEPGTIQRFTSDQERSILSQMDMIVSSFRFN